jgi:transposase-like protein
MNMPRKVNESKDIEIMEYLGDHTYSETALHFGITETQVSRIKKRSQTKASSTPEPETKLLDENIGPADQQKDAELIEPEESRIVEPSKSGNGTRHQKSMQTHSYKQNKNLFYQKKLVIKSMIETLMAQGATKDEIQDILNQY